MSRARRARAPAAAQVGARAASIAAEDDEQPDPGDEHRLSDAERAESVAPRVLVVPEWLIELEANAPEAP